MIINYNAAAASNLVPVARPSFVWIKPSWAASWALRPDLIPVETVWSVAPTIPTATVRHFYGRVSLPGNAAPSTWARANTLTGSYILILHISEENKQLWWLGYVDKVVDEPEHEATLQFPATGTELLTCFGLAKALEITPILKSRSKANDGADIESLIGFEFNQDGKGNRFPGEPRFAKELENAEKWSSRSIVEYLAKIAPRPAGTNDDFWIVDPVNRIPDKDRPTLRTDGRTFADVLGDILSPNRLLGYDVRFRVSKTGNTVDVTNLVIHPFTMADADITFASGSKIMRNPRQHILYADADPLTKAKFADVSFVLVDRVVVRGGNLSLVTSLSYDNGKLEEHWDPLDQTRYVAAGSTDPGYAALEADEQKTENQRVRETYRNVFRRFHWKDGVAIEYTDPVSEDACSASPLVVRVLDRLPMYLEVDYSETPLTRDEQLAQNKDSAIDETNGNEWQRPLCYVKHGTDFYTGETLGKHHSGNPGKDDNLARFQVEIEPIDEPGVQFMLQVKGTDQHAIAGADFTPLPIDDVYDRLDWKQFELLIGLELDRKLEVVMTSETEMDFERTKIVYAGPAYYATYLEPGVAIRVPGNDRKTAVGGWIHDDSWRLQEIAEIAYRWYTRPRRAVTIESARITALLELGDLVLQASGSGGARDVLAPVTEIAITSSLGTADNPPEVSQRIVTWVGDIDPTDTFGGSDEE